MTAANEASRLEQARQLAAAGRLPEARQLAATLCREQADNAAAWLLLGSIHGHLGELAQAGDCLRTGLALQPQNALGHYQLAAVLKAQGHPDAAIRHYRQTLQLQPSLARAHNDLGVALQEQGRFKEASECYQNAIRLNPDYAMAYYNLGSLEKEQQHYEEATRNYRKALEIRADFAEAQNALGLVQQAQENFEAAVTHYQSALSLNPGSDEFHYNLGRVLMELELHDQAQTELNSAVELNPERPEAWCALANTHRKKNAVDEAMACYLKAADLRPGYEDAIAGQAEMLKLQGKFRAAYELVSPFIAAGSDHTNIAINYAALSKRFDCMANALALLNRIEQKQDLKDEARMRIHFALGKLNDGLGNHEAAFSHYHLGNALKGVDFDSEQNTLLFDSLIATFSKARMPYLPRSSVVTDRPVFIIGMPRSGTTLVEQILASHPKIYGAGELSTVTDLAGSLPDRLHTDIRYPACVPLITRDIVDRLAQNYLEQLPAESQDALRVTDKLPHNFLHLGLIELLFPGSRIIHCRRDPRDNCLSIYFCDFSSKHYYSYDMATLGRYYLEYERLMQHWKAAISLPVFEVQYEHLVADQASVSRALVEFCGVEWDEHCLDFHKTRRVVHTASYDQVRNPMYSRSVGRWKKYSKYLQPLFDALDTDNSGA